jgi:hypothetical protein
MVIKLRTDEEVNAEILERRQQLILDRPEPQVGDWVIFNDCERRISHIWRYGEDGEIDAIENWGIQTSQPWTSYYLGEGYIQFSGSLYMSIDAVHLEATDHLRLADVWFFNRGWPSAHCGRSFKCNFKVWKVDQDGPSV